MLRMLAVICCLIGAVLGALPVTGFAATSGACEIEEYACYAQCDDLTDDCLSQIFGPIPHRNPGYCWDFNLRCRSECIDDYQTCRFMQPV